jgi:hypothetical protein
LKALAGDIQWIRFQNNALGDMQRYERGKVVEKSTQSGLSKLTIDSLEAQSEIHFRSFEHATTQGPNSHVGEIHRSHGFIQRFSVALLQPSKE